MMLAYLKDYNQKPTRLQELEGGSTSPGYRLVRSKCFAQKIIKVAKKAGLYRPGLVLLSNNTVTMADGA